MRAWILVCLILGPSLCGISFAMTLQHGHDWSWIGVAGVLVASMAIVLAGWDVSRESDPQKVRQHLSKAFYTYFAFISAAARANVPGFYWEEREQRCGIVAQKVPFAYRWRAAILQQRVHRWRNAAKRLGMSTNPNDYAP